MVLCTSITDSIMCLFSFNYSNHTVMLTILFHRYTTTNMAAASGTNDLSSEMELDAFRRLFPLRFHERHLLESIRPDGRPLGRARDTSLSLGLSHCFVTSCLLYC